MSRDTEHYDPKTGNFGRRITDGPVTKGDLEALHASLQQDIRDIDTRFSLVISHWDTVQEKTEKNLQRQLDQSDANHRAFLEQNAKQHGEILEVFRDKLGDLVDHAERRVDALQAMQQQVDEMQDFKIAGLTREVEEIRGVQEKHAGKISALEQAPTKAKAGRWDKVAMAVGGLGIAILSAWATVAVNQCAQPAKDVVESMIPAVTPSPVPPGGNSR